MILRLYGHKIYCLYCTQITHKTQNIKTHKSCQKQDITVMGRKSYMEKAGVRLCPGLQGARNVRKIGHRFFRHLRGSSMQGVPLTLHDKQYNHSTYLYGSMGCKNSCIFSDCFLFYIPYLISEIIKAPIKQGLIKKESK